ncbi:MAG TPA: phosphate ABC transporter substrate-binding protein PstS [Candidatus Dormibacteraeota bacterium]
MTARTPAVVALWAAAALTGCGSGAHPAGGGAGTTSVTTAGNPVSPVTVTETGSTLMLPYLQRVAGPLQHAYSNIALRPSGGGSGRGIADALAGAVDLGGSDAYLSNTQQQANLDVLDLPVVVSAQSIDYNLPSVGDVRLNGDVLARMYRGDVTRWNDAAIAALNPGVALPATTVVPVRRAEPSGDTFIFTQFLANSTDSWRSTPGYGATVGWPAVPGELSARGNAGMVSTCAATPGCVAYVGVSVAQAAAAAGLGEAQLQNRAGNFLRPTHDTVSAALYNAQQLVPEDLRQSLVYASGANSYPIVNYEYLMVRTTQHGGDRAMAIRTLLSWLIDPAGGSSPEQLSPVNFVALPDGVLAKVRAAIPRITAG